ncbi:hypothetical protein QA600_15070 [Natronococcus sp. A-GB1]|uniref:hypothetical protein n=1 Tax=Natronococcus sp. A-GB1 TaxID=3037648 RepID=UPI00241F3D5F|nr:hypothetical protein [Natronococcus sp. A-GB1]MDG5760656.1 hypothetical protein [Natronococcus sp. A-GB1]
MTISTTDLTRSEDGDRVTVNLDSVSITVDEREGEPEVTVDDGDRAVCILIDEGKVESADLFDGIGDPKHVDLIEEK